jgi:OPA family glycerol-3-phosphate transporter-like MFS transporter
VRDTPSHTGHPDFEVGDDSSAIADKASVVQVFVKMLTNPVILLIVGIEFCTGFLRNGVMSWYPKFSKAVSWQDDFVTKNWGLLLCVFGIVGGMFAGVISDKIFNSRRGPVASVLYGGITPRSPRKCAMRLPMTGNDCCCSSNAKPRCARASASPGLS